MTTFSNRFLEFSGTTTLKKVLAERLPKWINTAPETAWWNRYCTFGKQVCGYREAHPKAKQLGKKELACVIADGEDPCRPDFRNVVEEVLNRNIDLTYTYLDSLSLKDGYSFLLCNHCQITRSSPFAIYRITPHTPAEVFVSIGISLALEAQFEYKIPKIVITENVQDVPSLLTGYEVCLARNDRERKTYLKKFIPEVLRKTRQTSWKPRPLPFIELTENQLEESEPQDNSDLQEGNSNDFVGVHISNLPPRVTAGDLTAIVQEYGTVTQVDLPIDSQTGTRLDFALVEMATAQQAKEAVEALNNAGWMGRTLRVKALEFEELTNRRIEFTIDSSNNKSEPRDYSDLLNSLRESPSKFRIYELSRVLDLDNKDVLAVCNQLNISVKSHSSTISASEAEKIIIAAERYTPPIRPARVPTIRPEPRKQKKQQILEIRKPINRTSSINEINAATPQTAEQQIPKEKQQIIALRKPSIRDSSIGEVTHSSILESQQNRSIYIGNLSYQVTSENLRDVFLEYGKVTRIQLPTDRTTGRPRGFAFIEMATEAEANVAIETLDGADWMGRQMKVNKAIPRDTKPKSSY